ncbi:MAG TPA: COX15/CtaA family protein [Vicinamibacteria bacterium]|nr:COX15/CtaA family protein [Vicinamibacteria bacterium]
MQPRHSLSVEHALSRLRLDRRRLVSEEARIGRPRVLTGSHRLPRVVGWLLAYTVVVILWGAFVRATGSGAGCGSHWPLCNGEVIPREPRLDTLIELGHRITSGLLGLFVLGVVVAVFRAFPPKHPARQAVGWSLFFVVTEALIGAGLVRFEWVGANDSEARVYMMALHLTNTFLLLAAITMTVWWIGGNRALPQSSSRIALLSATLVAVLVVGASGAVTALGDTLLLQAGVSPDESPVLTSLIRARSYHPTLAIAGFFVVVVAVWLVGSNRYGRLAVGVFALQLALGAVNVKLMAPVWMQLLHLGASNVLWILLVLFVSEAVSARDVASAEVGG